MSRTLGVRNPRTGEIDYQLSPPTESDLDALTQRLRAGQVAWREKTLAERAEVLLALAAAVRERNEAFVAALSVDTGRNRISRREALGVPGWIEAWCAAAPDYLRELPTQGDADQSIMFDQQRVPIPLIGVISPWNYPLTLSMIDATPALLAGCSVVVKPSEVTPRFVEPMREAIKSVPEVASVLAFVQGDGETGSALVDRVDAVCFTGSVATGKKVAAQAAPQFKKVFLELGGKDPAVILDSADLDAAATTVVRGAIENTGQTCFSIERVYVDQRVHDAFVAKVVELCESLRLSYPDADSGQVGPFIFSRQADIVADQLRDARERGAKLRCGGAIETLGGGSWLRPTVVTGVNHSMVLMQDETFGPVIPIMPFENANDAVALANDTRYGLSGIVFGNEEQAQQVARRIDAGGMSVNGYGLVTKVPMQAEKHAFNQSGAGGSRFGPEGIQRFFRKKMIAVNRGSAEPITELNEAAG